MIDNYALFLAMTPAEIPDWFVHISAPALVCPMDLVNQSDRIAYYGWAYDGIDLPEHLKQLAYDMEKFGGGKKEWDRNDDIERYIQWRKYYANLLTCLYEGFPHHEKER